MKCYCPIHINKQLPCSCAACNDRCEDVTEIENEFYHVFVKNIPDGVFDPFDLYECVSEPFVDGFFCEQLSCNSNFVYCLLRAAVASSIETVNTCYSSLIKIDLNAHPGAFDCAEVTTIDGMNEQFELFKLRYPSILDYAADDSPDLSSDDI